MKSCKCLIAAGLVAVLLFCLGAMAQQATPTSNPKSRKHRSLDEMRQMFHDPSKSHEQTSPKIQNPSAAQALNPPILAQIKAQKMGGDIGPGHTMGATGDGGSPAGGSAPCDPATGSATPAPGGHGKDKDKDHHHDHTGGGTNPPATAGQPCNPATGSNPPGGNPTGGNPSGGNPTGGNPTGSNNPPAGTPGSNPPGSSNPSSGSGNPPSSVGPTPKGKPVIAAVAMAPVAITPPPADPGSKTKSGAKALAPSAALCPPGNGPAVFGISGKAHEAIFTQDPAGNPYTIAGCRFGDRPGSVYLDAPFKKGAITLVIDSWSDSVIKAHIDPQLAGELDQNNVSLVVNQAAGPSSKFGGHKFYAQRETVTLTSFPQGNVKLADMKNSEGLPLQATNYASPFKVPNWPKATPHTAGVERKSYLRFGSGGDSWDLSGLAPGFAPVDFQLSHWYLESCFAAHFLGGGDSTVYTDGKWSAQWWQNSIVVTFGEQHCHISGGFMGVDDDESDSTYALDIRVVGPKGVDPWAK
jgi:hypothetical protein